MGRRLAGNLGERPWYKAWIWLLILVGILALSSSCSPTLTAGLLGKQVIEPSGQGSGSQARLQQALEHLKRGEYNTAQKILNEVVKQDTRPRVAQEAGFYLGIIMLYEMDDLAGMEACRAYFGDYVRKYHTGPYGGNAAKILQFVEKQIRLALRARVQAREIRTLRYQIQKLEEIQEETERKRQAIETE